MSNNIEPEKDVADKAISLMVARNNCAYQEGCSGCLESKDCPYKYYDHSTIDEMRLAIENKIKGGG